MKKFLMVVVMLFVASMFFGADKLVAPVKPVIAEVKVVFTYEDWRAVQREASLADEALEYPKAVEGYLKYAKIGEALGRKDLKAWGLNNAAFCIIKMHKNDKTVDLNKAKALLNEALAIADKTDKAFEDIVRCLESNSGYVTYWLGVKPAVVAPVAVPVKPEVKK